MSSNPSEFYETLNIFFYNLLYDNLWKYFYSWLSLKGILCLHQPRWYKVSTVLGYILCPVAKILLLSVSCRINRCLVEKIIRNIVCSLGELEIRIA